MISIWEHIGDFIWKMRHHDEVLQDLEAQLEEARLENERLQQKITILQQKICDLKLSKEESA